MPPRVTTLFFDMNSYFASVWQAEEPGLRGRPLGIATTDAPGASLIAASKEAKAAGVRGIVRVGEARRICPAIQIRPAMHDLFVDYHHRILRAVDTVIPIHKAHSVDECSCLLMGSQQDLPVALRLGRDVQQVILDQVSPALTCSVGVAPNKLLAKIAAELHKPSGLNWLTADVLPEKIAHLKLGDLPGVSKGMLARLDRAGVQDVRALFAMSPKGARALWHSVEGERFLRQLHGETVEYPKTERHSLGHGQQLTPQNRTPEGARLVARRLLIKAGSRLRREGLFARSLHVSAKCGVHGRYGSEGEVTATQDTFTLLAAFDRYWARIPLEEPYSVGIMLGGLVARADHVADLFEDREAGVQTPREALCATIDGLNRKYGQDAVRIGQLPPHKVAYSGAKIAFGRIPEVDEFHE